MSFSAAGKVSSHPSMDSRLWGVAFILADTHNEVTGKCHPSIEYLERRCNCSRSTIQRSLHDLEELGVIKIISNFVDGRQTTNSYEFMAHRGSTSDTHEGSTSDTHEGSTSDTQNQEEESGRINNNVRGVPFDVFWGMYPKKENKKKAEAAWRQLSQKKQRLALKDIAIRYAETDRKYIPLPTTYIHGERWDDEPAVKKKPKTAPYNFSPNAI